jgi:ureidoglycolate hydrolase
VEIKGETAPCSGQNCCDGPYIYWHTPKIKYEKTKEFLLFSNFGMDGLTQPQNPFTNASISNRVFTTNGIVSYLQSIYWHTPKIKYEKTKEFLLVSNFSMDRLTQPQNPFVNASISNRVGTINGIISYLQSRNLNSGQNTKKQNTTQ